MPGLPAGPNGGEAASSPINRKEIAVSSMSKIACLIALGAAMLSADVVSAELTKDGSVAAPAVQTPALREGKAIAPVQSNAKLAVYIKPGFIVRAKNVSTVTTTGTGIYCIKPTGAAGLTLAKLVPIVSVEWGTSSAAVSDSLFAYYQASASDCPSGTIEVRTYDDNSGFPVLSSGIAFTLIVQ